MTADHIHPDKAEEFAIEDFKGWLDSMHRSEEIGEKRLEFFVTFATAVLGAVGLLAKKQEAIDFGLAATLAACALPALLILGILTFLRMLHRDSRTDEYIGHLNRIRDRFAFDPNRKSVARSPRRMINGGLTPVIIAVNAILLGLWAGILAWMLGQYSYPRGRSVLIFGAALAALIGFGFGWVGGLWCKKQSEHRGFLWRKA